MQPRCGATGAGIGPLLLLLHQRCRCCPLLLLCIGNLMIKK